MSLFKVREFWSIECDVGEKFDQNSLVVSKLNGDYDKIIIGSHNGILRIFAPSTELNEENNPKPYKAADLLLEKLFTEPILQVSVGKLVSGSPNTCIAVLFPLSIAIYDLLTKEGETEHGTQNLLKLKYEHKLKRSAFNSVIGPFGGIQNRDFICVQSLDGLLTFFEQESYSFSCFLPKFLLPSYMIYVKKTDGFVTVGSTWTVESFSYKRLSEAGHMANEDESTGVKIESDWSFNLGEGIVDLNYLVDANNESFIVMLGERNFYCLSCNGILKFMKKLDFMPICFCTYVLDQDSSLMTLMISETNTLLVYQNTTVAWSAQLSFLPISINRAFFKNVKGALVLLSEDGNLNCSYLGTDPQLFTAPPLANQELDFEKAEEELTSLNRIIKNYYSGDAKLTNTVSERELHATINVNPHLIPRPFNMENPKLMDLNMQMCAVSVDIIPKTILEEVQILLQTYKPFTCDNKVEFFNSLNEKTTFTAHVYLDDLMEISTLNFEVTVSYISSLGVPRVVKKQATLPLKLIMETCGYTKESEHKIILNINQNPAPLTTLFPEFIGENLSLTSNAVGFKNMHGIGSPVTVLLAKNSQRYRLQSDSFISLNILVQQMISRLNNHFSSVDNFAISYTSALPVPQFLDCVKNHFDKRKLVNELQKTLNQLGGQFRIIQKRLITKFKDRNPTSLSNLEKLLQDTHSEVIKVTTNLEAEVTNLEVAQNELSCGLQLLANLIKLMDVSADLLPTIETTFSPMVYDVEGQNWEDTLDASLCHLLRTIFSKSEKEKIKTSTSNLEEVTDITRLEKHISQVLDRFVKGSYVLETENEDSKKVDETKLITNKELLPIGSRIGESSVRILSARKGLSRKNYNEMVNREKLANL